LSLNPKTSETGRTLNVGNSKPKNY
jgi:hypothetical protein